MRTSLLLVALAVVLTGCSVIQIPQHRKSDSESKPPMPPLKPIRSMDDFLQSQFCAAYKCRFNDSWREKNGQIEEIYKTRMFDDYIWTEHDGAGLVSLRIIIGNHGDWSADPDQYVDLETWQYIDDFLAALNGKSEDPKMSLYAHMHFKGTVNRLSDTKALRYGSYRLRIATVGTDPTIDARLVAN